MSRVRPRASRQLRGGAPRHGQRPWRLCDHQLFSRRGCPWPPRVHMKVCTRVIDNASSSPSKASLLSPVSALSKRRVRMFKPKTHHSERLTSLGALAPLCTRPHALCPPGNLSTSAFRRLFSGESDLHPTQRRALAGFLSRIRVRSCSVDSISS